MPTNLTKFMDWKSEKFELRLHGDELHILDRWMNTIVRINVMAPELSTIEILNHFGFRKVVSE